LRRPRRRFNRRLRHRNKTTIVAQARMMTTTIIVAQMMTTTMITVAQMMTTTMTTRDE